MSVESLAVSLEATFVSFPETNMALHRHSLQHPICRTWKEIPGEEAKTPTTG